MKLYTKRGDEGLTDLYGGRRVSKDDLRVEAYGTVDELNSLLGLAISSTPGISETPAASLRNEVIGPLRIIQSRLFEIGADLATPREDASATSSQRRTSGGGGGGGGVPRIGQEHVTELEGWIDAACAGAPAMRHFILPGGTELAARLHVARTVCRRAERLVVSLAKVEPVGGELVVYLNRLSDLLFALARQANHAANVQDVPWIAPDRA